jgi:2-(1,2-epoxy-1,2-dihydrophenyl)acetyl-CoA isomerase
MFMADMVKVDVPVKGVLQLTMDDPSTLNSLRPELVGPLVEEVERFRHDRDLRVLVLTGSGRAFTSGANVRGFHQRVQERERGEQQKEGMEPAIEEREVGNPWEDLDPYYYTREGRRDGVAGPNIIRALHFLEKPSIAAVNGHAVGEGCGIALSCDIRVAAESAKFNIGFVRTGMSAGDGSAWQLPKHVSLGNALWMHYSGQPVDGQDAYRMGLATWCVPDDHLIDFTLEKAAILAKGPTYAYGITKQLVLQSYQHDIDEHFPLARRAQGLTRLTHDHKEGVSAFVEKRQAEFLGY